MGESFVIKEIIIIAGGNGSGKTTFAQEFLLEYDYEFLNADEIAKELSPENPSESKISAGRIFFIKLKEFIEEEKSFLLETTLSGRYLLGIIEVLREKDYHITIIFLLADSPEILIERIKIRVQKGGHFVPDEDVRRRFNRGKRNFWRKYKNLADEWILYYNINDNFRHIATGEQDKKFIVDKSLFERFLESI